MGNPDLSSFAPESEEEKRQKQSLQLVFNQNLDLFQASKQGSKNKGGTALVDMDKVGALNLSDATKNKQSLLSVFEAGSSLFDHTAQRKTSSNSNAYNARQLHSSAQSAKSLHQRVLVESDADEQMLFFIPFNQPTKIKSMIFRLANHADECVFNPSTVKLFKNKRNMDFNDAVSDKPTQMLTVELPTTDTCGEDGDHVDSVVDVSFPLKFVSFQDVSFLTIFIEDNQGDMDVTKLRGIQLIGEIKEVWRQFESGFPMHNIYTAPSHW